MPQTIVRDRIPEWKLQAAGCAELDSMGQEYAASLEGVRLNPHQAKVAKATGMKAGEPDIRLYFYGGRTVFVELKGEGGSLNADQKIRIPILRGLGFTVHVVRESSEESMRAAIRRVVEAERSGIGHTLPSATWWPKVRARA